MKSFNYNRSLQQENIESILSDRKKRLARQQIIFTIILLLIGGGIAVYFYRKVVYTDFDGFVQVDLNEVRAVDDLYIIDVKPQIGDIVRMGDTLFSFVYVSQILEQENSNDEPEVIYRYREAKLQLELARQELAVLQVKTKELKQRMDAERNDAAYGLTSNTALRELEGEWKEYSQRTKEQGKKVRLYEQQVNEAADNVERSGYSDVEHHTKRLLRLQEDERLQRLVHYSRALTSSVVTNVCVPDGSVLFKKENILTLQPTDLQANNFNIMAYVPVDKIRYIDRHSPVEVIVTDELSLKAHVAIIGARNEQIPENLRSNFSRRIYATVVILTLDPNQQIPFWALSDNMPVTVRIRNLESWKGKKDNDVLYFDIRQDSISGRELHKLKNIFEEE